MKRRRKKALSPLMAMLLAVAAMVLVVGRMATPAFSAPGPATHLSLVMDPRHAAQLPDSALVVECIVP